MDLGFGDRVEPIEYPMDLIATSKGPLFESRISLHCYPKEFIFAEKLETVVFRGGGNTRMKDFHDLYSLIRLDVLDNALAKKAVQLVFYHRKTPPKKLPVAFGKDAFETLQKNWTSYLRKIKAKKGALKLPESMAGTKRILLMRRSFQTFFFVKHLNGIASNDRAVDLSIFTLIRTLT